MSGNAVWKDEYLIGDEFIDGQHKELIAICRRIEELADSDKPVTKEQAHACLLEMFEEFRNHFDEEMQLYRRVYRLAYTEHEQHHADFLEKLNDILEESQKRPSDLKAVVIFARNWFINHIVHEDMPQFEEMRARGYHREEWGV